MKLRRPRIEITDDVERKAEEALRKLAGNAEPVPPPPHHFANLIVRTNEAIDRVTSGKALSISWLARVAVPGVVAILFFFIGLHYYGPSGIVGEYSIAEAIKALPAKELDSILVESSTKDELMADIPADVFDVSSDQLADFYLSAGHPMTVLETLSEQQLKEVATLLESRSENL